MIHHRTPEFSRELADGDRAAAPGLRHDAAAPLPVHTTGRGALEATICNLFSPGDEIAVCCNGKFGEMWAGFAESYGARRASVRDELGARRRHRRARSAAATRIRRHPRGRRRLRRHVDRRGERRRGDRARRASARRARAGGRRLVARRHAVRVRRMGGRRRRHRVAEVPDVEPGSRVGRRERTRVARRRRRRLPRNYWDFAAIRTQTSNAQAGDAGHDARAARAAGRRGAAADSRGRFRATCIAGTTRWRARVRAAAAELGLALAVSAR